MACGSDTGHHCAMALEIPAFFITKNNFADIVSVDEWSPSASVTHIQCDDGEYYLVHNSLGYGAGDVSGFTRISTSYQAGGNTYDVFQRNLSLL